MENTNQTNLGLVDTLKTKGNKLLKFLFVLSFCFIISCNDDTSDLTGGSSCSNSSDEFKDYDNCLEDTWNKKDNYCTTGEPFKSGALPDPFANKNQEHFYEHQNPYCAIALGAYSLAVAPLAVLTPGFCKYIALDDKDIKNLAFQSGLRIAATLVLNTLSRVALTQLANHIGVGGLIELYKLDIATALYYNIKGGILLGGYLAHTGNAVAQVPYATWASCLGYSASYQIAIQTSFWGTLGIIWESSKSRFEEIRVCGEKWNIFNTYGERVKYTNSNGIEYFGENDSKSYRKYKSAKFVSYSGVVNACFDKYGNYQNGITSSTSLSSIFDLKNINKVDDAYKNEYKEIEKAIKENGGTCGINNISNRLYREANNQGIEYVNRKCQDPRRYSDKGYNEIEQRYYLRGLEAGNFACERFDKRNAKEDDCELDYKNVQYDNGIGGKKTVKDCQEAYDRSLDCCIKFASSSICVNNISDIKNDDYESKKEYTEFCLNEENAQGVSCTIATSNAADIRLQVYDSIYKPSERLCIRTHSLCPYNFNIANGTEKRLDYCEFFIADEDDICNEEYDCDDEDKNSLDQKELCEQCKPNTYIKLSYTNEKCKSEDKNKIWKEGKAWSNKENMEGSASEIDYAKSTMSEVERGNGRPKNFCQLSRHCTDISIVERKSYEDSKFDLYLSPSCDDFVGDSQFVKDAYINKASFRDINYNPDELNNPNSFSSDSIDASYWKYVGKKTFVEPLNIDVKKYKGFTAPATQCITETLFNLFFNKSARYICNTDENGKQISINNDGLCGEDRHKVYTPGLYNTNGNCKDGKGKNKYSLCGNDKNPKFTLSNYRYFKGEKLSDDENIFLKIQSLAKKFITLIMVLFITITGYKILGSKTDEESLDFNTLRGKMMFFMKISLVYYFAIGTVWKDWLYETIYTVSTGTYENIYSIYNQNPPEVRALVKINYNLMKSITELEMQSLKKIATSLSSKTKDEDGNNFENIFQAVQSRKYVDIEDKKSLYEKFTSRLNKYDGCYFPSSLYDDNLKYLSIFDFVDCKLNFYLSNTADSSLFDLILFGIASLVGGTFSVLLFTFSFILFFMILAIVIKIVYIYVASFIYLNMLIFISPIIFPTILFEKTKGMFDGWFSNIWGLIFQPIILMAFIPIIFSITDQVLIGNVQFKHNEAFKMNERYLVCPNSYSNYDSIVCIQRPSLFDEPNKNFLQTGLGLLGIKQFTVSFKALIDGDLTKITIVYLKAAFIVYIMLQMISKISGFAQGIFGGPAISGGDFNWQAATKKVFNVANNARSPFLSLIGGAKNKYDKYKDKPRKAASDKKEDRKNLEIKQKKKQDLEIKQ